MTDPICLPVEALHQLGQHPPLYEPGEPVFWDDPHISQHLLDAHLNPNTDTASRRPETVDAVVSWLIETLAPRPDAAWLDLGCGPGLYASRLAQCGLHVTGIDFSRRSIAYARDDAVRRKLDITYRLENYLELEDEAGYDVVSLIYGDFCPLPPADRATLLDRVHRALKPGGHFVFDLSAPRHHALHGMQANWYAAPEGGFWRPDAHLVLEHGFAYPDDIFLDQYVILIPGCDPVVYRFWFQDYTPERIAQELAAHGFRITAHWADLLGTPYTPESTWLGVVAQRE
ncbi:class I SAM-dependent methyltransferase [Aggregatilinea lenta]|uniref:class I SAM-dependent methyltransferase n=1 Tax=Aggregatilinea lenta TaxID=913108 RepID=UPI000E5BAB8F|nr:class I SAM-dependent methyltransferase [Aggregatilinea lenta]